jgi:hypothetical protein
VVVVMRHRQVKDIRVLVAENMYDFNLAAETNTTVTGNFTQLQEQYSWRKQHNLTRAQRNIGK